MQPLRAEDPRLPAVLARFRSLGRNSRDTLSFLREVPHVEGRLLALALRESFVVPLPLAARRLNMQRAKQLRAEVTPVSWLWEATVLRLLRGEKERRLVVARSIRARATQQWSQEVVSSELPEPGDGLAGEFLGACVRPQSDMLLVRIRLLR